jgi:hypothetical protein
MRWGILLTLNFIFILFAGLAAITLGNTVVSAALVPDLNSHTNIVVRWVFYILIAPDKLFEKLFPRTWMASWSSSTSPSWRILLVIFLGAVFLRICLVIFTPLYYRITAAAAAKKQNTDTSTVYAAVRQRPDVRRRIKRKNVFYVTSRSFGYGILNFAIGGVAAGFAAGIALFCNTFHNGVFQVVITCIALLIAAFIGMLTSSAVEAFNEDRFHQEEFDFFPDLSLASTFRDLGLVQWLEVAAAGCFQFPAVPGGPGARRRHPGPPPPRPRRPPPRHHGLGRLRPRPERARGGP